MKLPNTFISCDWGTSKFRLQKVHLNGGQFLSNHSTDRGIKECYEQFTKQTALDQKQYFTNILLEELEKAGMDQPGDTLVVASGMLSSSLGLEEMDYATLPVPFSGENLISKILPLDERRNLLLISGVRSDDDVMRGEETQAIGLAEFLPENGNGILLLPGTHSKHITFNSGYFTGIQTYMTGELFDLLVRKSILQGAILPADWNMIRERSFLKGVEKGINNQFMGSLFRIRARNLLDKNEPEGNYFFLSGLLIGAELSHLTNDNKTIYLGASGRLSDLYRRALESFLPLDRIIRFDTKLVKKALLTGQKKILKTYA